VRGPLLAGVRGTTVSVLSDIRHCDLNRTERFLRFAISLLESRERAIHIILVQSVCVWVFLSLVLFSNLHSGS
jgi:hypothetical protein